jgi:oxygen-independent coproporphyrinogen-3 oxidase
LRRVKEAFGLLGLGCAATNTTRHFPDFDEMKRALLAHAGRDLPRYTSYPTALQFSAETGPVQAHEWAGAVGSRDCLSLYVHVPFCEQLCWYCGCHTSVPNGYDRVAAFARTLEAETHLWEAALGEHAGAAHLHLGGGSPNALKPDDFARLMRRLGQGFGLRPDAEIAIELDPRALTQPFVDAMQAAGVNRASLGVQTFDPEVQARVNRIQPFERIAWATDALRQAGVKGLNFDLMYGLPGQTPETVSESARLAVGLRPDRVAVFGYAHVPWFKKHQQMIRDEELADTEGRWEQAEAADAVLTGAGYVRIGLDHYALPGDALAEAAAEGGLRRNFQGYTVDPAPALVAMGPSAIGRFSQGFVQNHKASNLWAHKVEAGRLPVERGLCVTREDRLRAELIERVMCDLAVDVGAVCTRNGARPQELDGAFDALRALERQGLCTVDGLLVTVAPEAARLVRVVASAFDTRLNPGPARHSAAV